MYLHTDSDGHFNKTYIIMPGDNYTKLSIIREIALQKYAYHLWKTECKTGAVVIPRIITFSEQIITIDGDTKTVINIKMEKMELLDKSKRKIILSLVTNFNKDYQIEFLKEIYSKITRLLDCLEKHGIYHNDTHNENIDFVKTHDSIFPLKLVLLDFGKATVGKSIMATTTGIPKRTPLYGETLTDDAIINLMTTWLTANKDADTGINLQIKRYGGKRQRPTKHKRSRDQKKTTSRKKRKSPI